ncbi:cell division protein FtsZ [Tepidicaulis sp. LMO-SS28]|uniref:cell division protein FtsZ n=1 Tax=Tepidicaulis sp. LMO-SS28 TaxID=3447455 RepID=UPI003EE39DAF
MSINLSVPKNRELKPRITVFGVGGAGGNAVNNMIEAGLEGCDFVVANTDAQALQMSSAERRIQLGANITEGLGAGSRPEVGCAAAEEALAEIDDNMQGAHMAFITAGMGGGTGTGGAPVIARAAREKGILTVGVVTKPFQFEGSRRMRIAEEGIAELQQYVDTLIVIPNQNLFRVANERTTFADAFAMADQVLHSGVAGITDLMMKPGLINLDFADVRTVMNEMGKAMMGTGEADGEKRAVEAAEAAISNPLLDEVSMKGARGVLINITGGMDLTLYEVDEAANRIRSEVDPDANIIVGSTFDSSLDGRMRVSVVATGIDIEAGVQPQHRETRPVEAVSRPRAPEAAQRPAPQPVAEPEPEAVREREVAQQPEEEPGFEEVASAVAEQVKREPVQAERVQYDPNEYEAEVILHKPGEAPRSLTEKGPKRPYIPESLDRVESAPQKSDMPSFLSQRPQPVQQSRPVKRAPSFFERLAGGRKKSEEAEAPRREPVLGQGGPVRARAAQPQPVISPDQVRTTETRREPVQQKRAVPSEEGLIQPSYEEDQLEIPTFLRRQAN